jgi:hypothetical protein
MTSWVRSVSKGVAFGLAGLAIVLGADVAGRQPSGMAAGVSDRAPAFLQPGRCYRLTFPIPGVASYKILEHLDGGWVKAEVDAGPATARREPVWINGAQIVSARDARCSD